MAMREIRDMRDDLVGKWLSAALDDPKVCEEMKEDIREWFFLGPLVNQQEIPPPPSPVTKAKVRKGEM